MNVEIKNQYGDVLFGGEYGSLMECVEASVAAGASLVGASLVGANLDGASLAGASLVGASLAWASLAGASLVGASLAGASLDRASLVGANLDRASLVGASLAGASLEGAKINWQSHQLLSEILLRAAGDDYRKRQLAGLVRISPDWCWDKMLDLKIAKPLKAWALDELAKWVQPDDGAPECVRERVQEDRPA